jgi:hypothetical protein
MGLDPPKPVIAAKAGIHDLTIHPQFAEEKSWMPAYAGMTLKEYRESLPKSSGIT